MAYGVYDITLWYLEQALKGLQRLEQATAASTSPPLRGLLEAEILIRWLPTCGEAVGARYVLLAAPDPLSALTLLTCRYVPDPMYRPGAFSCADIGVVLPEACPRSCSGKKK
jgi:hypothetical protein